MQTLLRRLRVVHTVIVKYTIIPEGWIHSVTLKWVGNGPEIPTAKILNSISVLALAHFSF